MTDLAQQIWCRLRGFSDVSIKPYSYQPSVLADAWNHNWPISPNVRGGSAWSVLRGVLVAKKKSENYEANKSTKKRTRKNHTYDKPMHHPDRFWKHSPNRHWKRAERRAKQHKKAMRNL